ncbi:sarcosine dehydrogenase, mitochondrial-like [Penaeus indicus]|uniref:sarcosine dehydrogenase, mitochondrial-like n=1 Tax=Penaeus indicus TaxID=29960 RepID=UPI00300D311C
MMLRARNIIGGMRAFASPVAARNLCGSPLGAKWLSTQPSRAKSVDLPSEADAVVIGGGVMGCFTLYQLARLGCSPLLLERSQLTSGTTWHTNGLLWSIRPGDVDTAILNITRSAVLEIEKEEPAGWTTNGGLFIANNMTRLEEYSRLYTLGRTVGVPCELLGPREVSLLYPMMEVSDVTGALHSPGDGTLDPSTLCRALVNRAKLHGAKVCENVGVTNIETEEGMGGRKTIRSITTTVGRVKTDVVINCAGVWSPDILKMAGSEEVLPVVAMKHSMVAMDAIPGVRKLPNVRDHDANMCLRVQGDSLIIGGYELNAPRWEKVDPQFAFGLFDFDMNAFSEIMEGAVHRVPQLAQTGIKATICGPEAFTPDRKPLIGEDAEVTGMYHGSGFNSSGMMMSGGCAEQLAQWVVHGRPALDMTAYDCRRFSSRVRRQPQWAWEKSHESYVKNYSIVFPRDQPLAGRRAITDPLFPTLTDAGCFWEEAKGWERPAFFTGTATPLLDYDWRGAFDCTYREHYPYRDILQQSHTFNLPKYYKQIEHEYLAMRDDSAVINQSSSGKMLLSGTDAERAVDWLFASDVERVPGFVTSSLVLNTEGGVEADVTVYTLDPDTRLECEGEAKYLVTCGSGMEPIVSRLLRDLCWKQGFSTSIKPITHETGILTLYGPNSLQVLSATDIDTMAIHPNRHQLVSLAGTQVRVCERSDVCWEIHAKVEELIAVYEALTTLSDKYRLVNAGYYALNIIGLEQGSCSWNSDIRRGDTPLEAGVWRPGQNEGEGQRQFLGRPALLRQAAEGVTKSRVLLELPGCPPLWGGEAIVRDGAIVGGVRRADHSFECGCPLASGYVAHARTNAQTARLLFQTSRWEVERMGERFPAVLREF